MNKIEARLQAMHFVAHADIFERAKARAACDSAQCGKFPCQYSRRICCAATLPVSAWDTRQAILRDILRETPELNQAKNKAAQARPFRCGAPNKATNPE